YQLPILIFVGVAWAGGYAIVLGEFVQRHPVRGAMLLLAVTLAPLAATIGKLHIRLIGERVSTLGPLFVSTVAGVFLYSELVDHSARFEAGEIVVDVCVAILGMLATIRLIYEWIRQPRQHLQVLGPELANLPRAAFCFSLLAPAASLREAPILVPIAWCALPFLLCVSLVTLVRLVAAVHQAEEDTDGGVVHSADQHGLGDDKEVQAPLPSTHSGPRSLMRAALYLHRRSSWFRPGELRTPRQVVRHLGRILPMVLYHGWGVLLAWLALAHPSGSRLPATLGVFAGLTAPTFVAVNLSPSLRRLGVDYVDQVRHNLRALLWLAVLPTMLAGGIAGTIAGWDDRRALVLAILAATFAVRAGWRGLARQAEGAWTPAWVFLTTIALLVLSYLAPLQSWPAAFAGAVLGLVGLVLRWRGLEEVTLANAVCAREEL
ncbi:MAG TPA: hypothetical protein VK348_14470, partial [Planctomycetota bacterium]|nr:hypothetical protein [Planctomycetota bacterium]